jgi:hypothetical protein
MAAFWSDASVLDKIFFICATLGGMLFIARTALMFLGGDTGLDLDIDMDVGDVDIGGDSDASFNLLSIQSLTVFFLFFGLAGLSLHRSLGLNQLAAGGVLSVCVGTGVGLAGVWLIGVIMSYMAMLQSSGTMNLSNAIGESGTVYLHISAGGTGKVEATIQGRLLVMDAVAEDKEADFKTDDRVVVVDIVNDTLVVKAE